jgi:hypothetical protein
MLGARSPSKRRPLSLRRDGRRVWVAVESRETRPTTTERRVSLRVRWQFEVLSSDVSAEVTTSPSRRPFSILRYFLDNEASGGLVLMAAAALALIIANSPLAPAYFGALHAYGHTFEQIGAALGVGRNQARILTLQWQRHLRAQERIRENPDDIQALGDTGALSRRLAHALVHRGITTVPQMAALYEQDWRRIPMIGPAGIKEARAFLATRIGWPTPDAESGSIVWPI